MTDLKNLSTEELLKLRQESKNRISKYSNNQMARKIQINSLYGACGNQYFRYYRLDNAEAITLSGQVVIRLIEKRLNQYFNELLNTKDFDYVIASDTDSIYLNMNPLVQKIFPENTPQEKIVNFLDEACREKIEKFIDQCYSEFADYVNAYEQKMKMKRETIADTGIWTAKKRYMLNVLDKEGVRYEEPEIKVMGMASVSSSTPEFFRPRLKKAYEIILRQSNDDLIDYVNDLKIQTRQQNISDIAFTKSINNLGKYSNSKLIYSKGTPIQVRGALLYNHWIKKLKLENRYPFIQDGDKIKFVYLKQPNPIKENVIGFLQDLPPEFDLENYIDYNSQFEIGFVNSIKSIVEAIDWVLEKRPTIDLLFE